MNCSNYFDTIRFVLPARSISDDLSSGDAARFRDDEYGKSEVSGMGAGSSARSESAHKGEKDKEKKEKDKEDRDEGERVMSSHQVITNQLVSRCS